MLKLKQLVFISLVSLGVRSLYAAELDVKGQEPLKLGVRLQNWIQWTENGALTGKDKTEASIRRLYLYLQGKVHPQVGYFLHLSGDRIGQSGITEDPGKGFGSGMAIRDAWVHWDANPALRFQLGRMNVPFLRTYGTESTFSQLTIDVPSIQQGDLVPGRRVGRDDGLSVWGSFTHLPVQYRLAFMNGSGLSGQNGTLRVAGRLSVDFADREEEWFNSGTYLGKKKIFSIGAGYDQLPNFVGSVSHHAWTSDVLVEHPLAVGGAWNVQGSVTRVDQENTRYTGTYYSGSTGLLLPWTLGEHQMQPYIRLEQMDLNQGVTTATADFSEVGGGVNVYLFGLAQKLKFTIDGASVKRRTGARFAKITAQFQLIY